MFEERGFKESLIASHNPSVMFFLASSNSFENSFMLRVLNGFDISSSTSSSPPVCHKVRCFEVLLHVLAQDGVIEGVDG